MIDEENNFSESGESQESGGHSEPESMLFDLSSAPRAPEPLTVLPDEIWVAGKVIARDYEVIGRIGEGGMGIVYLLNHKPSNQLMAAKRPKGQFLSNRRLRLQFSEEAVAWTELAAHPHIVSALDALEIDFLPCIIMEYVDGPSLSERVKALHSGLPVAEAVKIGIEVAWAMSFAHQHGHIHRDLKPSNILMSSRNIAKVTDFGLVAPSLPDGPDSSSVPPIMAGGTWAFMAPEQWDGAVRPSVDIYAFGITMCVLVSGRLPLDPDTHPSIASSQKHESLARQFEMLHKNADPFDPSDLNPDVPGGIANLIMACMQKNPADRPCSFDVIAEALMEEYKLLSKFSKSFHKPTQVELDNEQAERRAWALLRLGKGAEYRADTNDALARYQESENFFIETGNQRGLAVVNYLIGNVHFIRGELDQAMERYLCGTRRGADANVEANSRIGVGNVHWINGNYSRAISEYTKALEIFRKIGDTEGLSKCLSGLGMVYRKMDRFDDAIDKYREAIKTSEDLGDLAGIVECQLNLGESLQAIGEFDEAMRLYESALDFFTKTCKQAGQAVCYFNMGEVCFKQRKWLTALKHLEHSRQIRLTLDDPEGLAECEDFIASVKRQL